MPKYTSEARLKRIAGENALFLRHLRQTGNATMSAELAGGKREMFAARARKDEEFGQEWRTALVFARAALERKGGAAPVPGESGDGGMVAAGGEYMVGANLNNGLQVRRARPGHVTAKGERAFLAALAQTANIALAAESVGVNSRAFYKRRAQSPAFAQAMHAALEAGYEAVEFALLKTALRSLAPESAADGGDAAEPVEPLAQMTVDQAMELIAQRRKTMAINDRHQRGMMRPVATREETNAAILKKLAMVEKGIAMRKAREEKEAARFALPAPGREGT